MPEVVAETDVQDQCITDEELRDIVECLNDDIYEHFDTDFDGEVYLEYRSVGVASCITFLGVQIWNSEEEGYCICGEDILDAANKLLNKVQSLPEFRYQD